VRRPLPPDLLDLGDRLERAAAAALARRRVRRQQVLNAVASVLVAVPLALSLGTTTFSTEPPAPPAQVQAPASGAAARPAAPEDVLPRGLRNQQPAPNSELLVLPSSLRPALR
jgi:hypothetical protein